MIFVLLFSNIVVSLAAGPQLKPHLRILMFTLTIATAVTIADLYAERPIMPEMSASLGPFIPLIIVNCIIIGRAEACASKNGLVDQCDRCVGDGRRVSRSPCVFLAGIRELLATGKSLRSRRHAVLVYAMGGDGHARRCVYYAGPDARRL